MNRTLRFSAAGLLLLLFAVPLQAQGLALRQKWEDGGPLFMSLITLTLVVGLAISVERVVYLLRARRHPRTLLAQIEQHLAADDVEAARQVCRETPGPVASVCYQGLLHSAESLDSIERNIVSYGTVQASLLERGCSWISLCIAIAPSIGFLGTVVGMMMAFDQIEIAGDIGPTIVAGGMKVALITTIYGIIVALVLQVCLGFIQARADALTLQMEEAAISVMDLLSSWKSNALQVSSSSSEGE